jgi:hypothetical protein
MSSVLSAISSTVGSFTRSTTGGARGAGGAAGCGGAAQRVVDKRCELQRRMRPAGCGARRSALPRSRMASIAA